MPFWKKIILILSALVFAVSFTLFVEMYWREYDVNLRIQMFCDAMGEELAFYIAENNPEEDWPDWVVSYLEKEEARHPNPVETDAPVEQEVPEILAQYEEAYAENNDLIGWIRIEGTQIDYPVMQTPFDPEYYLHRNTKGIYDYCGTPFLDATSDIFGSSNYLIYAHNMIDGSMFGELPRYLNESYWRSYPTITFDTIYESGEYEVVAAFLTRLDYSDEPGFRYFIWGMIDQEDEFNYYVENVRDMALYETGVEPEWGDQLLTLSTCYYHTYNGRMVLVARKIN